MKSSKLILFFLVSIVAITSCVKSQIETKPLNNEATKVADQYLYSQLVSISDLAGLTSIEVIIGCYDHTDLQNFLSIYDLWVEGFEGMTSSTTRIDSLPSGKAICCSSDTGIVIEIVSADLPNDVKNFTVKLVKKKDAKLLKSYTTVTYKGPSNYPLMSIEHKGQSFDEVFYAPGYKAHWYTLSFDWENFSTLYSGDWARRCYESYYYFYKAGVQVNASDHSIEMYNVMFSNAC